MRGYIHGNHDTQNKKRTECSPCTSMTRSFGNYFFDLMSSKAPCALTRSSVNPYRYPRSCRDHGDTPLRWSLQEVVYLHHSVVAYHGRRTLSCTHGRQPNDPSRYRSVLNEPIEEKTMLVALNAGNPGVESYLIPTWSESLSVGTMNATLR